MFNKYRIITFTRNMSDGETTFTDEKDTEKEALDLFRSNCASYGNNPATKTCEVVLFDTNGNIMKMEMIDNTKYMEK